MVIFAVWKLSSLNFCQLDNLQCDCSSTSSEPHFSYIHDGKFVSKNFTRMGQWTHCSLKQIGTWWIGLGNDMMNWVGKFWHKTGNQWPLSTNWCSPRAAASCILCAKSMTILPYRRHSFLRASCVLDLFCTSCIPQWRLTTKVGPISILCGPFEGVNIGPYW